MEHTGYWGFDEDMVPEVYSESLCEKHSIMYHGSCPLCDERKTAKRIEGER